MYLPRNLISKLYLNLRATTHPLSPPVLILVALDPDALCGCRILTRLLKHDYIPHKIQPVAGYGDLERVGRELVVPMMKSRGGSGGVVVCLGVGGMVDLGAMLGLEKDDNADDNELELELAAVGRARERPQDDEESFSGVEVWVLDAHRPWNLSNVFGGFPLEPEHTTLSGREPSGSYQSRAPKGVIGGKISRAFKPGRGGIIVFDDGDIEEDLVREGEAYLKLVDMPDVDEDADDDEESESGDEEVDSDEDGDGTDSPPRAGQKRKSWSDQDGEDSGNEDDRPRQKRRSNESTPIADAPRPPKHGRLLHLHGAADNVHLQHRPKKKQPSARTLRRRLIRMKRQNEEILSSYYRLGTAYAEPVSAMMYALASELGREDNDLLWLSIIGVTSMELYGKSSAGVAAPVRGGTIAMAADEGEVDSRLAARRRLATGWFGVRGARLRQLLRDEVRRLNPPDLESSDGGTSARSNYQNQNIILTSARSPEDHAIRLSPEPRFLLVRHWSLYDSMVHSPYLASRLRLWNEAGVKRLHKLLAKMGVSLVQCRQNYVHMDMQLKRDLRSKLLKYAKQYNLDDLVPGADSDGLDRAGAKDDWGFVRSWGWRATLSAQDVGVVVGALLEVGKAFAVQAKNGSGAESTNHLSTQTQHQLWQQAPQSQNDDPAANNVDIALAASLEEAEWVSRFWTAYDALENPEALKSAVPTAQYLHRAILRTGSSIINKRQIKHLRAFRMFIVRDGPDVALFSHPSALTKLALWIGEAIAEQEKDTQGGLSMGGRGTPLVAAALNEAKAAYLVVGTGGGGGPDSRSLVGKEEKARRKREREEKLRLKAERKNEKEREREERRRQRREAMGEDDDEEDDEDDEESDEDEEESEDERETTKYKGYGLNKFGTAFQDVVQETSARVRIDSFEHCVVEVRKEDLSSFLESLSMKTVVG